MKVEMSILVFELCAPHCLLVGTHRFGEDDSLSLNAGNHLSKHLHGVIAQKTLSEKGFQSVIRFSMVKVVP